MTALNEYDRADRYADGRTRHDDATTEDIHGPGDTGRPPANREPLPPPCPVCLKFYGHYDERHGGAA